MHRSLSKRSEKSSSVESVTKARDSSDNFGKSLEIICDTKQGHNFTETPQYCKYKNRCSLESLPLLHYIFLCGTVSEILLKGGGAQLFGSRRPEGHQFFAPFLYAKIENKTSLYFSKLDSQNKNFQGFNYFVTQFPDPLNS